MGSEQQFCLRWNNHQSTLISVFDSLLESGTLVDVTLAAEGKFLKAHKVVLSACSQYFQELLSNHRETHPIIILKDVSFQEVKALIDYMYRGEVNVSQEQLSALIKTAESLKIKGLADGGDKKQEKKTVPQTSTSPVPSSVPSQQHTTSSAPSAPILPIEPKVPDVPPLPASPLNVREGSISPVSRKRKKQRRRSGESIESEATSTLSEPPISLPNIPASILPVNTVPSKSLETEEHVDIKKQCVEDVNEPPEQTPHPPLLTPKTEYPDDDSVENITLDDDDDELDMDRSRDMDLDAKPGPSHGGEGPASGQGTGHLGELYSFMQRHAPSAPFEVPQLVVPPYSLDNQNFSSAVHPTSRDVVSLTDEAVDSLLLSFAGDVMFRKYSVHTVKQALEAVLKKGISVTQASIMFGIKRSTLQFYLKKLNIVLRK